MLYEQRQTLWRCTPRVDVFLPMGTLDTLRLLTAGFCWLSGLHAPGHVGRAAACSHGSLKKKKRGGGRKSEKKKKDRELRPPYTLICS